MKTILFGLIVVITSCSENHENNTTSTDSGDTDTDTLDSPPLAVPYGDALVTECVKRSACQETALTECLDQYLGNDDGFSIESIIPKSLFLARRDCIASAEDCDSVEACLDEAETAFFDQLGTEPCDGHPEFRCEDDRVIWCLGPDGDAATEPTDLIYDLSLLGKTCNDAGTDAVDPQHTSCNETDYPNGSTCNGPLIESCSDGTLLTFDCRHVDPEFVCTLMEGDQPFCTKPSLDTACDGLTSDLYTSFGRCDGTVATLCVSGKLIEADCSDFGAACADDGSGEVFCEISE